MPNASARTSLPRANDRLQLGASGHQVSPLCLGIVGDPDVVSAAYDAGVNFFFLTGDLHWPLYENLRAGLRDLLARGSSVRDDIVVGVVSYLDQPMFRYLQFHEVIGEIPGLERVDVLLAGAVPHAKSFNERYFAIAEARARGHLGARGIGASFHDRATALASLNQQLLDVHFVRYNAAHPGAEYDLFPHLRADRLSPVYNFKTQMSRVSPERFVQLRLSNDRWLPHPTDYYRFVLSHSGVDGVLCSPGSIRELEELVEALDSVPLTAEEHQYMTWLASIAIPQQL